MKKLDLWTRRGGAFQSATVSRQPVDQQENANDSDPGGDSADDLGIRRTEQPAEIIARVVAKNSHRLQSENPTCMQADREI